jgi:hypothetical protein
MAYCLMCDRPRPKRGKSKNRFCGDECRDRYVREREEAGVALLCETLGVSRDALKKTESKYGFAPFLCLLNETHSFNDKTLQWEHR